MLRQLVAIGMALISVTSSGAAVVEHAMAPVSEEIAANLKQQVVLIPAGTLVEVKFLRKGEKSFVGRLGPVSDSSFEVQGAKDGNVSTEKLAFADVKSVKAKGKMHPAVKGAIIGGVAVGVLFAVFGIIVASGGID